MENKERIKIVFYSPPSHSALLREAIAEKGAGRIGDYSHCSFTIEGITRFKPLPGATPEHGAVGKLSEIKEDRIETFCDKTDLNNIINTIRDHHPYDEPAIDVYPVIVVE